MDLDSRLWNAIDKKKKMIMKNWGKKEVENENPKSKFSTLNLLHKACTQKFNSREGCGNWKFLIKV